jgi:L-asparaginase
VAGGFLRTEMIDRDSIVPHRDVEASSQRPRLIILSTGGTIAMTTETAQGMTLCAANLIAAVPRLADLAEIEGRDVLAKPSADFMLADIAAIADATAAAAKTGVGIVITHGTDTLEESAFALSLLVQVEIPIVFTAAMRRPDQPGADGPANLLAASRVAISPASRGKGLPIWPATDSQRFAWIVPSHSKQGLPIHGCIHVARTK